MEHYKHKYLCLYPSLEEYDNDVSRFEECNYSIIEPQVEMNDTYLPSTRTTNNDNEYLMKYNAQDNLTKKFFLEILWGYFGWEWVDYVYNNQTLKGGNLYKVRETENVVSIEDGNRLLHINNFLNSQDLITLVNTFDTSNIIAANRAFERLKCTKIYRTDSWTYYLDYIPKELTLLLTDWNALELADYFFLGNNPKIENDLNMPKITSITGMYMGGRIDSVIKLNAPNLTSFDKAFEMVTWYFAPSTNINLNDYFTSLPTNLCSLLNLMRMDVISTDRADHATIQLDLTSLSNKIDLTEAFCWLRHGYSTSVQERSGSLNLNLSFNSNVILDGAFKGICDETGREVTFVDPEGATQSRYYFRGIGFKSMNLSSVFANDKLQYITSIKEGLAYNTFDSDIPLTQIPNENCDDSEIYKGCIFNCDLKYDFSPDKKLITGNGQFKDCTINQNIEFTNAEYIKDFDFSGITLTTPYAFPCNIHNNELLYSDITNYTNYRTTLSFRNSNFTSIKDSDIYYYKLYVDNWEEVNVFYGCKNIDFTTPVNVYYEIEYPSSGHNGGEMTWDFRENTSMTVAPILNFNYGSTSRQFRINLNFKNLSNLKQVDLSKFIITANYEWDSISLHFNNCTSLKTVKFSDFTKGIDFTGCYSLDVDNLVSQLKTAMANKKSGGYGSELKLLSKIWNLIEESDQNELIKKYDWISIILDEEEEE